MTTKVTKESLEKRIKSIDATERCVGLSLQAEYNREVYKMLLALLEKEDGKR